MSKFGCIKTLITATVSALDLASLGNPIENRIVSLCVAPPKESKASTATINVITNFSHLKVNLHERIWLHKNPMTATVSALALASLELLLYVLRHPRNPRQVQPLSLL
jgi:hypothetical protein